MKRTRIKRIAVAVICMLAFSASAAMASNVARTITVYYQDIKMYVDGQRVNTSAEPFIYNGTTYLPVRAAGEALGENVYWDGSTRSIYIGERPGAVQYLMEVCPPYQVGVNVDEFYPASGEYFLMAGERYMNGITSNCGFYDAYFNTNSQYNTIQFTYGPLDGYSFHDHPGTLTFIGDGIELASYVVNEGDMPKTSSLSIDGVNQLIIRFTGTSTIAMYQGTIGVGNITVQ